MNQIVIIQCAVPQFEALQLRCSFYEMNASNYKKVLKSKQELFDNNLRLVKGKVGEVDCNARGCGVTFTQPDLFYMEHSMNTS